MRQSASRASVVLEVPHKGGSREELIRKVRCMGRRLHLGLAVGCCCFIGFVLIAYAGRGSCISIQLYMQRIRSYLHTAAALLVGGASADGSAENRLATWHGVMSGFSSIVIVVRYRLLVG